jgi:hypothetical protein
VVKALDALWRAIGSESAAARPRNKTHQNFPRVVSVTWAPRPYAVAPVEKFASYTRVIECREREVGEGKLDFGQISRVVGSRLVGEFRKLG